jgi:2-haloacid dehalogenase
VSEVVVFEFNETLLDLAALDPSLEHVFGDASARQQWFTQVLQSALVVTVIDGYVDSGTIGAAALEMMADRRAISLSADDRAAIHGDMLTLPPHPEVSESLAPLCHAGFRLATLTNSTEQVARAQLTNPAGEMS